VFGIVQPCRHTLPADLKEQWRAHLCGLCLGLRDGHGQAARLTTNVDAVALSVLTEAQRPAAAARRRAGPCPLRGGRTASVVRADDPGVAHAVAVSLTMAATKVADHVADGDGWVARVPVAPAAMARRWGAAGDRAGAAVAFDTEALRSAVAESDRRERVAGLTLDAYAAPTEEAAARSCRHTAVLADRPGNEDALDELGRCFGRLVYLVDAVRDRRSDEAAGRFNVLAATGTGADRAAALLGDAHRRLAAAFDRLDLPRPALARALLVDQVGRVVRSTVRAERHGPSCRPAGAVAVAGAVLLASGMPGHGPAPGSSEQQTWWDRIKDCCDCSNCCDCCEACSCCGDGEGCCGCCDCDCCGCDC
jgi:hypothetical protein